MWISFIWKQVLLLMYLQSPHHFFWNLKNRFHPVPLIFSAGVRWFLRDIQDCADFIDMPAGVFLTERARRPILSFVPPDEGIEDTKKSKETI